ncbi:hypothetical protein JKF63_02560 [Porcisia hertigi]|uniref:Uncharacterized protein n=1 Tax=Porcisia hertigi TaxID=2761500 RepID=A0A836HNW6_9TRYP|nr:hypothetical protein JKF63_02560 [Porcisia hertigi]
MPKKHRVKRQNYVAHLRNVEKERDTYLEKRRAHKRSREVPNEELMDSVHNVMEGCVVKKRRTEAHVSKAVSAMNEEKTTTCTPAFPTTTTAPKSFATAEATMGKRDFFSAKPFKQLVRASAPSSQAADAASSDMSATVSASKKTLKRRHY